MENSSVIIAQINIKDLVGQFFGFTLGMSPFLQNEDFTGNRILPFQGVVNEDEYMQSTAELIFKLTSS